MPSLALLLAAATGQQPGAIAFVYPRSTDVAVSAAILAALTSVAADFPPALDEFRHRGLHLGQRVAVMPTEHVYEYDGPFHDPRRRFDRPQIRLRIIEQRNRTSPRVSEPTIRVFPADEIARLKLTARTLPLGKQNTPLGDWRASPLDELTGIRSGGNTGLLRNRVLLLSSREGLQYFLSSVSLSRAAASPALVGDVITAGSIAEGGALQPDDRFQAEDQPLVAVTHLVERLADACDNQAPCSKFIFVDGAGALARNHQAFDSIAARQRLIVIADHEDEQHLRDLAARGCRVWRLTEGEILLGSTAGSSSAVTTPEPDTHPQDAVHASDGLFYEVKRSAAVADRLHIASIPVQDEPVSSVADSLARASELVQQETDDNIRKPVGLAFGALLELASWLGPPGPTDLAAYLKRLDGISAEVHRLGPWAPAGLRSAIQDAVEGMAKAANNPLVGWPKLEALVVTIDGLRASGRKVGLVVPTAHGVAVAREHLPEYIRDVSIFSAGLVPQDACVNDLLITSWLKHDAMRRLINLYLAADVRLFAFPFEQRWLSGLVRRRRASSRYGELTPASRAVILGLTEDSGSSDNPPPAADRTLEPSDTDIATSVDRLGDAENWAARRRKGLPADPADEHEQRPARYVGFVGDTYAYVTVGRALPVVTDLVRGRSDRAKVPLMTIDQLRVGEYVLFRDQGERDVISLFAEHEMGTARYKERRSVADRWKRALTTLGASHSAISHRLREIGISKHAATIRSWSLDADKIGPGSRSDIDAIARAVGQSPAWAEDVWNAILEIRGAHIAAGQRLSQFLLSELPKKLTAVGEAETHVDLTLVQAWVVEIHEIGEVENRSYTEVNRLLWG